MYDLYSYGRMTTDAPRMAAYAEALRRSVRPGCVVADVGAGTGIMTLLACRFGARRVYAIEPDDVIQVARELVRENGDAGRVEFFQALSTSVELPERADVIVSDLRGVLPLLGQHLPAICDARARLLAPGGVLIPQHDTLWAAPLEGQELYSPHTGAAAVDGLALRFDAVRRRACNTWRRIRARPEQLLAEPQSWGAIDYRFVESPDLAGELRFAAARAGTAHGLLVWFDTQLVEGVGFSNAPTAPETVYGSAFFPLAEPVPLEAGDVLHVTLRADLVGADYVWRWDTRAPGGVTLSQSTFFGAPLSPEQLRKQEAGYVPALNEEGEMDLFILVRLGQGTPLSEIAAQVAAKFPGRFGTPHQALTRVGELSLRYSR